MMAKGCGLQPLSGREMLPEEVVVPIRGSVTSSAKPFLPQLSLIGTVKQRFGLSESLLQ